MVVPTHTRSTPHLLQDRHPSGRGASARRIRRARVARSSPTRSAWRPWESSKAEGLGMGLSVNRSIVEAHGGTSWRRATASAV